MNDELINQLAVQVAQLRTQLAALESRLDEAGGDTTDDLFLRIGDTSPSGGGTHMGNTGGSEEIDGDVVFASASDANVEVKTEEGEYAADGVFVLREAVAPAQLVPGLETDGAHVKVNRAMETNLPGMFACGDITGTPYQYVKAAGEGNVAALSAAAYIDRKEKEEGGK